MCSKALALLAASVLACGSPEKAAVGAPAALRNLAGPSAVDCGSGRNAATDETVSDCAGRAIAGGQPFFCVYENWRMPVANVAASAEKDAGGYALSPAGTLYAMPFDGEAVAIWEQGRGALRPMDMNRAVEQPGVEELSGTKLPALHVLRDPVFVMMTVTDKGVVANPRVISRALPIEVVWEIQDALRGKRCSPATLFGVPVSVNYGASFKVSDGELRS